MSSTVGKRLLANRRALPALTQGMQYFTVNKQSVQHNNLYFAQMRAFSGRLPPHIKLEMPNLSPTMEKGNIAKWLKKEGDSIKPGDILAQIETDKATVDFEMQEEGYIAKLLYPEGTKDVKLGQVVAIIVDSKDDVGKFKDYSGAASSAVAPAAPKKEAAAPAQPAPATPAKTAPAQAAPAKSDSGRVFVSPLAKKLADEAGLDLSGLQGSGPNSRIIKSDVEAAIIAAKQAPAAKKSIITESPAFSGDFTDLANSNIRKVIADRLSYSKQNIPHYYVTVSVHVDALMKLRARLNAVAKSKISINDMVIKAASLASVKVPETNSSWMGEHIRRYRNVNMSVAVQTEFGLMAPVITNTHLKGLEEIASEIKDIAARARENKLKPEELSGGTFTISNLGMYGVHNFSAIVNPPQACILAVSAAEKRVVIDENAAKGSENPYKIAHVMNVTLSSDHRVVDGAVAAQWGQEFKKYIENPEYMLL
jgi:pyruvate dehydrogenase E2 component (dihydrolipoamide acetyltransferase)